MPTGTASAALLLLLAVCVRARAWVCTTPFALASLELNRDCAVVPVCVFRRSAVGMRTSLSVCLFAGRACDYLGRSCRQNHRCKCHGNPLLWHSGLARPPGTYRVRVPTVWVLTTRSQVISSGHSDWRLIDVVPSLGASELEPRLPQPALRKPSPHHSSTAIPWRAGGRAGGRAASPQKPGLILARACAGKDRRTHARTSDVAY
jgi:hypothetical protein